jgi:hypothetical protein
MSIHPPTCSARFPEPQLAEAAPVFARDERDGPEEDCGRQTVAALALVAIVLLLMFAPAVVAGASLLNSKLLDRFQVWFGWSGAPTHYLDLARLGSTLVLSGFLSNAREDG